jgi:hypothetical protein
MGRTPRDAAMLRQISTSYPESIPFFSKTNGGTGISIIPMRKVPCSWIFFSPVRSSGEAVPATLATIVTISSAKAIHLKTRIMYFLFVLYEKMTH